MVVLTFVDSPDGDVEVVSWTLVAAIRQTEAEVVVASEAGGVGGPGVMVPDSVHVHVVLSEVLTSRQVGQTGLNLSVFSQNFI